MNRCLYLASLLILFSACSNIKNVSNSSSINDSFNFEKINNHHEILKEFTGIWNYKANFYATPRAEPQLLEGENVMETIYDGKFLRYQSKSKSGSQGIGYIGYNNSKQKYETFWIDNMVTGMMSGEAQFDEVTRTLKGVGEYTDPSQK